MRILVSNDDGIQSPGLLALAAAAEAFGVVKVAAPDSEQSAMGHAITVDRPLLVNPAQVGRAEAIRINGTPADCVALGLHFWQGADLVLSGINLGSNLGHEIWYSGTVAAARQAALLGVRAAAFSLIGAETGEPNFRASLFYVEKVIRLLMAQPALRLINVNLPPDPKGIVWTRQSVRAYEGRVITGQDPYGRTHYWLTAAPLSEPEEGTDRWAAEKGLVSVTPLHMDLTDEALWESAMADASALGFEAVAGWKR